MKYPMVNVSMKKWKDADVLDFFDFDGCYYNKNRSFFKRYSLQRTFCDSEGNLFRVEGLIAPTSWWRKTFYFLPMVYKQKITYYDLKRNMPLEDLKAHLVNRIKDLTSDDNTRKWIDSIEAAATHEEAIIGQV